MTKLMNYALEKLISKEYERLYMLLRMNKVYESNDFHSISVTVKASQNLHKEKASCNRMLFSFNHFSTGHEAGTA